MIKYIKQLSLISNNSNLIDIIKQDLSLEDIEIVKLGIQSKINEYNISINNKNLTIKGQIEYEINELEKINSIIIETQGIPIILDFIYKK